MLGISNELVEPNLEEGYTEIKQGVASVPKEDINLSPI
jgi:hypothetical protein